MNGNVLVVPIGVLTPMFLIPVVAVLDTFRVTVIVVEFTTVKVPAAAVTPPLSPVSPVAPVKFAPVIVTGTARVPVAGCVAEFGLIEVMVAPSTVNGTVLLVPPAVVMLTVLAVSAAVAEMVKFAVAVVGLSTVRPLTVTPPPLTVTALAPVRFVPVKVTGTTVPRTPVGGAIEVNVGGAGMTTVKVTALLVPPGAVTVTFRAVPAAVAVIAKVALTWVSPTTVRPLTVTPPPGTVIAVVPVRPLPKRLTATEVPRTAEAGEIDVRTGPVTV